MRDLRVPHRRQIRGQYVLVCQWLFVQYVTISAFFLGNNLWSEFLDVFRRNVRGYGKCGLPGTVQGRYEANRNDLKFECNGLISTVNESPNELEGRSQE
jgi:hypothetical protein